MLLIADSLSRFFAPQCVAIDFAKAGRPQTGDWTAENGRPGETKVKAKQHDCRD
jgi:hypothetical protein